MTSAPADLRVVSTPTVAVFAPSPILTIAIEPAQAGAELHLHAGGQGVWIAGMAFRLGACVELVASFGGEYGPIVRQLLDATGLHIRPVGTSAANGAYVHDRRGEGRRAEVVRVAPQALSRHEADDLLGAALVAGMGTDVTVLAGSQSEEIVSPRRYKQLAADLVANGKQVVADLTGEALRAAADGGATIVKVSEESLRDGGWDPITRARPLAAIAADILAAGPKHVLISRTSAPTMVFSDDLYVEIDGPRFEAAEARGTGDAMTGAIAAAIARGDNPVEAAVLGVAAGALNATRHGLATGRRADIEELSTFLTVRPACRHTQEEYQPCARS